MEVMYGQEGEKIDKSSERSSNIGGFQKEKILACLALKAVAFGTDELSPT